MILITFFTFGLYYFNILFNIQPRLTSSANMDVVNDSFPIPNAQLIQNSDL